MEPRATETETGQTDLPCPEGEVLLYRTSPSWDNGTPHDYLTEPPPEWVSWRFTTPFKQRIHKLFDGRVPYAYGFEKSQKGVEHFHVISLGHSKYDSIRKAIQRDEYWKKDKNTSWSKKNHGDFFKGLAYTLKCGDIFTSDDFPNYVIQPWVWPKQPTIPCESAPKRARQDPDRDWQLTYTNLVTQAVKYHRANGMNTSETLKTTVKHMMEHTKWKPAYHMIKHGVPAFYENDFKCRLDGTTKRDMSWWTPDLSR